MNGIESIIEQLERQREALDRALSALREIEGARAAAPAKRRGRPPGKKAIGKKRVMTAEARARIGDATRRRWALKKASAKTKKTARAGKKTSDPAKREMSAKGRASIAAAAKRMWAKKRAPQKAATEEPAASAGPRGYAHSS